MSEGTPRLSLSDTFRRLADAYRPTTRESFDFTSIDWANGLVTAAGTSGPAKVRVRLEAVSGDPPAVRASCSLCGGSVTCVHVRALAIVMDEGGLAADIEKQRLAPTEYTLRRRKDQPPADAWRSQVTAVLQQLRYLDARGPGRRGEPDAGRPRRAGGGLRDPGRAAPRVRRRRRRPGGHARHPPGTRGAGRPGRRGVGPPRKAAAGKAGRTYRSLPGGLAACAASADPLDREVADKFLLAALAGDRYGSRQPDEFLLPVGPSAALVGRLAQSGRLFRNDQYALHDAIAPVGWLGDDPFDLRSSRSPPTGKSHLRLGVCAVSPTATVPHGQLDVVAARYFFDKAGRLGLFARRRPRRGGPHGHGRPAGRRAAGPGGRAGRAAHAGADRHGRRVRRLRRRPPAAGHRRAPPPHPPAGPVVGRHHRRGRRPLRLRRRPRRPGQLAAASSTTPPAAPWSPSTPPPTTGPGSCWPTSASRSASSTTAPGWPCPSGSCPRSSPRLIRARLARRRRRASCTAPGPTSSSTWSAASTGSSCRARPRSTRPASACRPCSRPSAAASRRSSWTTAASA